VACIIDPDPARREKEEAAKRKNCWPYQLHRNSSRYDYFPESAVLINLREQSKHAPNIRICAGKKTLEYDLAVHNHTVAMLITTACTYEEALRELTVNPTELPSSLQKKLQQDSDALVFDIDAISDPDEQRQARFATCYLLCTEDEKGELAVDLMSHLRENLAKPVEERLVFQTPKHIEQAIQWACSESVRFSVAHMFAARHTLIPAAANIAFRLRHRPLGPTIRSYARGFESKPAHALWRIYYRIPRRISCHSFCRTSSRQ